MRNILVILFGIASLVATHVHAQAIRPYVSIHGAASAIPDDARAFGAPVDALEFDQGFGLGGAIGLEQREIIWLPSRFEGEVAYYNNETVVTEGNQRFGGDTSATTFMANVYYDIGNGGIQPYVGAGIGYMVTSLDIVDAGYSSDSDGALAYQLMAGANFDLNDDGSLVAFGGYRYLSGQDPDVVNASGVNVMPDTNRHVLQAGMRLGF